MIANVFLSSPALGTTKWCAPPLPEWAGIRADSRIIPALSLSGRAQVAIVDAKNGIKEGLQGNWFSCENNSGAQNTGAWVWITRPKSFMKRGAPRALRLKQSGSLPPLFLDNPPTPPPSSLPPTVPLSSSAQHSNFSPNNDRGGKPRLKKCGGKQRHKLFSFPPHFLFHFAPTKVWEAWTGRRYANHDAECLSRFWTLHPTSQAKASSVCIEKSCRERAIWAGRRHGSLAGSSVGVNMTCHWEGIRGYGWKGRPPCPLSLADCMQLWALLWTRSFAYVWQELREAAQAKRSSPV